MPKKTQVVALVEPSVADRLDAIRIVTGEARARVLEDALLNGGLKALEMRYLDGLNRVYALARRARMQPWQYARAYARAYSRVSYGPSLDDLELDDRSVTLLSGAPKPIKAKASGSAPSA